MLNLVFFYCLVQSCKIRFKATTPNPIEYKYGPRSVALGDFDNDTQLDMVVANSFVHKIAIYFGHDDGSFSTPISYSTGLDSVPYMVGVGDINKDTYLDIAVANFGTNSIAIFLGYGNRTFSSSRTISTNSSHPIWINVIDVNDDTTLDIITANYGTDSISIFYGYGNGTFYRPITYSTGYDSLPLAVVVGDFNNDNQLDLVTANSGTNNIGLFLSNGDGTFRNHETISTRYGSHPYCVVVGHFNNDIMLDIAVANHGTNNIGVFLGYGNGTFVSQITYSIGTSSPYFIGIGDFNNDARLDLVVANKGINNIIQLFGDGNGIFGSTKMYSTGSTSSISIGIGDFNNDSRVDITVLNNDTNTIDVLLNNDKGFAPKTTYPTGSGPYVVAVDDFNSDTHLDIVVANEYDKTVGIFLGYDNGSFANQMTYATGSYPNSVAVDDFNNDTNLDIVVANYNDSNISVLLGYGNGSFANQTTYSTGSSPDSVAVHDFNSDNLS